jgi:predicted membrane-bound spermidine synthase
VLPLLAPGIARATRSAWTAPWLVAALRGAIAFAILCVPATAMGATLPVIVGEARRCSRAGFGRVLGWLYGWNTAGGIAGVLVAELALIPRLGITRSAWVAGLLNLAAAALALASAQRHGRVVTAVGGVAVPGGARPGAARLLLAAGLAGASLMALEVLWFRFLLLFVVSSTLALSLMLAVVLTSIAAGAHGAAWWLTRDRDAGTNVAAVALLAGCSLAASYAGFQFMSGVDWTAAWYRILWFTIALTAPTSLLSGVAFTLLGERLRLAVNRDVRAAGWLTLANTTGAACGPPLCAFVLLPGLGMERALFGLMLAYCGIAALTWVERPPWRLRRRIANHRQPGGAHRNHPADGAIVAGPPCLPAPGDGRFLDVGHAPHRQTLHAAVRVLADAAAPGATQEDPGDLLRRRHDRAGGDRDRSGRDHRRGGDLE